MALRTVLLLPATIVLAAALSGCASTRLLACSPGDWYAVGFADGRTGEPGDRLFLRSDDCAARGIPFDSNRYEAGRAAGLREYCTVTGGIDAGRSGRPYYDVCSASSEEDFLSGYYLGALSTEE
jgi:hypothetical protein